MKELREYQLKVLQDLSDALRAGKTPVVQLATGAGKSLVMAAIVQKVLAKDSGKKVLLLAHRKELLKQNYDELEELGIDAGIYSAGLKRRELHQITVAGIQSIANVEDLEKFEICIIDEAHRIAVKNEGQYRDVISRIDARWVIGLTATPWRLSGSRNALITPDGGIFNHVVWGPSISEMTEAGFLCPLVTRASKVQVDAEKLEKSKGEYTVASSEKEVRNIIDRAVTDILKRATGRKKTIIFTPGIETCELLIQKFKERGESSADFIHSQMDDKDRDQKVKDFREGRIKWLGNVSVFVEGFNVPDVDCIVLLAPTESASRYIQQVGRGLRMADGKENCLILDFAGNAHRFGPIDKISFKDFHEQPTEKKKCWECPACENLISYAKRDCDSCGYSKPKRVRDIKKLGSAFAGDLVQGQVMAEVLDVMFEPYVSKAGNGCIAITYKTKNHGKIKEWVTISQKGFLAQKLQKFFKDWTEQVYVPRGERDAVDWLRKNQKWEPGTIRVAKDSENYSGGRYWEMKGVVEFKAIDKSSESLQDALRNVDAVFGNDTMESYNI